MISITAAQWLHNPGWSWRTARLRADHGAGADGMLDRQSAWRIVVSCSLGQPPGDGRWERWPGISEEAFATAGITIETPQEFDQLPIREKVWRVTWLRNYGVTPLQRLGATDRLMKIAGVCPGSARIDVFGGTNDGWASLLTTAGTETLATGGAIGDQESVSWKGRETKGV